MRAAQNMLTWNDLACRIGLLQFGRKVAIMYSRIVTSVLLLINKSLMADNGMQVLLTVLATYR